MKAMHDIARLSPATLCATYVTILLLELFSLSLIDGDSRGLTVASAAMTPLLIFMAIWGFAVLAAASAQLSPEDQRGVRLGRMSYSAFGIAVVVLLVSCIALLGFSLLGLDYPAFDDFLIATTQFASIIASIAFFLAMVDTARALEASTGQNSPFGVVVTFLLILYFPVGIWFLNNRVKRLAVS